MTGPALLSQVRALLRHAADAYRSTAGEERVRTLEARLDEPLRVAIAGKVKAGKSTLLNALVGEELAPSDAGECTRIVTWYRHGTTYRVTMQRRGVAPRQVPFSRDGGAVQPDLGGVPVDEVERLDVEWPSQWLETMSLIDTPGLASLSLDVSARAMAFLSSADETDSPADAVLYLLRHLHTADVRFLEAFRDDPVLQATPVNAAGVLSRADEVAPGRTDAMDSAHRIAARYGSDPRLRRLCQTVVPVAGLLAQGGATLREEEFQTLHEVARLEPSQAESLLLTADHFSSVALDRPTPEERRAALGRLGLFGVRLSVELLRSGAVHRSSQLAVELVRRSGVVELRELLAQRFASRRDLLKCRSALLGLDALLGDVPVPGRDALAGELEQVVAGAHELAELRIVNALRTDAIALKEEEAQLMERLLGGAGPSAAARLGLAPDAGPDDLRRALTDELGRWRRRASSPASNRDVTEAAEVAVRTCEGLLVSLP